MTPEEFKNQLDNIEVSFIMDLIKMSTGNLEGCYMFFKIKYKELSEKNPQGTLTISTARMFDLVQLEWMKRSIYN
jgi:hypothetical protein